MRAGLHCLRAELVASIFNYLQNCLLTVTSAALNPFETACKDGTSLMQTHAFFTIYRSRQYRKLRLALKSFGQQTTP